MALEYTFALTEELPIDRVADFLSKDVLVEEASHGQVLTANLGDVLAIVYHVTPAGRRSILSEFGVAASVLVVFRIDRADDIRGREVMIQSIVGLLEWHPGRVIVYRDDDLLLSRSDTTRQVSRRLLWTAQDEAAFPGWEIVE